MVEIARVAETDKQPDCRVATRPQMAKYAKVSKMFRKAQMSGVARVD